MHTSELGNKGVACEIFSENLGSIHVGQFQPLPSQISMGLWRYWEGMKPKPDSVLFPHSPRQGFSKSGSAFFFYIISIWPLPVSLQSNYTFCPPFFILAVYSPWNSSIIIAEMSCHSNLNWNDTSFWKDFLYHSNRANLHYHLLSTTFP